MSEMLCVFVVCEAEERVESFFCHNWRVFLSLLVLYIATSSVW